LKSSRRALVALLIAVAAAPAPAQTPKPRPSGAPVPARTPARPAPAAQHLDGIAAVVNDEVVLQSDVEEQLYLFLTRSQARPDSAVLDTMRRQVLDEMINEKLVVAEAKRQGLTVSEPEVSREVEKAIQEARDRLGPEGFREQLVRENMTEEQLRAKYREEAGRQQLAQRLVQRTLPRRPVPQGEAEAYFKAHPERFPKAPAQVRLSVIQIPVTADSAADAEVRARALDVRGRIVAGEKFAKLAGEVSEDPGSAKSGGDLGYFARGSMEPALERVGFELGLGQVSAPVRTPFGWHLLQVLERDTLRTAAGTDSLDANGQVVVEAHARHILLRVPTTPADQERARAQAERVRNEAVRGTDFGTLVRRYSRYQGPASADGDIGFVSLASLQSQIRAGLDTLEIGQISETLENAAGYNIFKVTDRTPERPYTLEEIRDQLPEAVAQIRFRERYDEWLKGLRAKAHLEIRSL